MSIERLIAELEHPDGDAPTAPLVVVTGDHPAAALASAFEVGAHDVLDAAALERASAELGASRAEGFAIVRDNIDNEMALVRRTRVQLDARLDELSREAEAIEAAIDVGADVADEPDVDRPAIAEALARLDAAALDPDGPDIEALALAEEIEALDAVRAHSTRLDDSVAIAAAEAAVVETRAELDRVRRDIGAVDPDLVAIAHDRHLEVEAAAVALAGAKRADRTAARDALIAAEAAEKAALAACGFETHATLMVSVARGGTRPEDDARLAAAQHAVALAEAARRRAAVAAEVPSAVELDDTDLDLRARAAVLLGHIPGDDPAAELRRLRRRNGELDTASDALVALLATAGIGPGSDPAASARAVLSAPPRVARGDIEDLEARLSAVDDAGAAAADEYDRLGARLEELEMQRAALDGAADYRLEHLDADDSELLVREWVDSRLGRAVIAGALDRLSGGAVERALAVFAEARTPLVIASSLPLVAAWAHGAGATVLDALPTVAAPPAPAPPPAAAGAIVDDLLPAKPPVPPVPVPAEPVPAEPAPAELVSAEPLPAVPAPAQLPVSAPPPAEVRPAPAARPAPRAAAPRPAPLPPLPGARSGAPIDARNAARVERAQRRATRRAEREARAARRVAEQIEQFAGSVYHQHSEVPPWAHLEEAAQRRRAERPPTATEGLAQERRAAAHEAADRVERRTGVVAANRDELHVCVFHRNTETRIRCTRCTEPFCDQCLVTVGPKRELICVECAVKAAGVRERRRR